MVCLGVGDVLSLGKLQNKFAETRRSVLSARVFAIVLCAMVFAVVAGPFGTLIHMTTAERILLWVPLIALSVLLGWVAHVIAQVVFEDRHAAMAEGLAVVLMTAIFTPCVFVSSILINPAPMIATGGPLSLLLSVFAVTSVVAIIRYSVVAWRDETKDAQKTAETDPRLLDRLPKAVRAPVLRISAKNHMIEVVTERAKTELRLRLGDAVVEMEPVEGFMTHRSHWVAKSAVTRVLRENPGKVYLKLVNGDLVPVSRTFRPDWINAGVLDPSLQAPPTGEASVQPLVQDPSEQQQSPRA